ncbi:hypothetical protein V6N13_060571 [Hibiscus sabdariffa]
MGSIDDWRPKLNRWLFLRGSIDDCRENWRLKPRVNEPDESWRENSRFSCNVVFSMVGFLCHKKRVLLESRTNDQRKQRNAKLRKIESREGKKMAAELRAPDIEPGGKARGKRSR